MKAWKYIAIALGIVTAVLAAGWFLRNTIIERISNPLLAEYGLAITDVSLDALATSDASISRLEVEHTNGTIITIDDLKLPLGRSATGIRTYGAARLTIELPADSDDEPLDLAGVLLQLLALPLQLPQTEIIIAELSVAPYPAIRDLRWQSTESNQNLLVLVGSLVLTANVERISDTHHLLNLSMAEAPAPAAKQSMTVEIQRTETGLSLIGTATLDLPRWRPVSTLLGIDAVGIESGMASLQFEGEVADDATRRPFVYADITPTTPVQVSFSRAADASASINVQSASTVEISATFPELEWSLRQAQATLLVSDGALADIPVSLLNLSCQSGTTCSADVSIAMDNAALPFAEVGRFEFAATQDVAIGEDGIEVLVRPDASIDMRGVSGPDFALSRFSGLLTSMATLRAGSDGWHFAAQSADIGVEEYAVVDDLTFSAQVFLDDISFREENQETYAQIGGYASSSEARLGGQLIRLPGFKGGIAREGEEIAVFLETVGLFAEASIEASHHLDKEVGQLSLRNAVLSFGKQGLASRVSPWPNDWNVTAGTVGMNTQAGWRMQDDEWQLTGQTTLRFADLAGAWEDTAFTGLSTTIDATLDTTAGLIIQPGSIEVALVDIGLPLENITADYVLDANEQSVNVENLRMTAFGGVITADPFSFGTANERNTLLLRASSIDLADILSIKDFETVEISGSIGAELPVTVEGKNVRVEGGRLTGEAPGGVIRYLPGRNIDQTDTSGIGIATRALSNFEYETLTSDVNYTTDGDLILKMRLTGRNPDLEGNRPVILNFGLEDNIPQMLRSLQAARAVEDILERRLAK